MTDAVIRARIQVEGLDRAKRALQGIRTEAQRTERDTRRASESTTATHRREARNRQMATQEEHRQARLLASRTADHARQQERAHTREVEQQTRNRLLFLRRFKREAASILGGMGQIVGTAALVGAGAVSAVRGRGQAYGGALGMRTPEQLMADYVSYERGLQGLAVKRGIPVGEVGALRERITGISQQTGLQQPEVLGALNQAQERYAEQFDRFVELFPDIASAAAAAGASLEDVVTLLGNVGRANPDLSTDDMRTVLNRTVAQGLAGSVEFASLAQAYGTVPGTFAAATRREGMDAVNEQMVLAQAIATGGATDPESATSFERLLNRLANPNTQKQMKRVRWRTDRRRRGIDVADENGVMRPIMDIVGDIQAAGLDNPRGINDLIGEDIYSRRALNTLFKARQNEAFMASITGATAEQGAAYTADWNARMVESGVRRAELLPVTQFAEFEAGGGLKSDAADAVLTVAETLATYETRHWEVIEAMGVLKNVLMTVAGAAFFKQQVMGGASIGQVLTGTGAGATGAGGAGAAGAGGLLGVLSALGIGGLSVASAYEASSNLTATGGLFEGGLPGAYSELAEIARTQGVDAALARYREGTAWMDQGATGALRSMSPGGSGVSKAVDRIVVALSSDSRQALASDIARAQSAAAATQAGGPARRGGQ